MESPGEHSPRILSLQKELPAEPPSAPSAAVALILDALLESTGAERAFAVVRSPGIDSGPRLVSTRARSGISTIASRSVLARALTSRQVWSRGEPWDKDGAGLGASVRALALRAILSSPFPANTGIDGAVVLDSRDRLDPDRTPNQFLDAAATLVALALHAASLPSTAGTLRAPRLTEPARSPVARGASMRRVVEEVRRVASSRLPIIVRGETGVGKEQVARWIHEWSSRHGAPFVAVNCIAFAEELLDAELFGSVRGAFTGADRDRRGLFREADRGTLFLDEIGDMPQRMQGKLLRVLQERAVRAVGGDREHSVDVRIVAATHHDLRAAIAAGRFREDLYYRLAGMEIIVPPLRERLDDLHALVTGLAPSIVEDTGLPAPILDAGAWRELTRHDWPGNVRELRMVLARAAIGAGGATIRAEHLFADGACRRSPKSTPDSDGLERQMIERALEACGRNVARAARQVGWSRQKLYRRIQALGIHSPAAGPRGYGSPSDGTTSSDRSTFQ